MKRIGIFLSLLLALTMLAACGASAGASVDATAEAAYAQDTIDATEPAALDSAPQEGQGLTESTPSTEALAEKIIYSAYAELETTDFDTSVQTVYAMLERYGGFMETSAVTGSDIASSAAGYGTSRHADFTLRIPQARYGAMTSALSEVGNVTYLSSNAENITAQYTDTDSRLKAYEVEEARLLDILGQAETVEDMISLESRLAEIRYQKESLTATLKNWDNQVAYSTVTLHLQEVQSLTPEPQGRRSYWQQVGDGFVRTLRALGQGCKTLFRVFVAALPVLIPLALVVLGIICLTRHKHKKRPAAKPPETPAQKWDP